MHSRGFFFVVVHFQSIRERFCVFVRNFTRLHLRLRDGSVWAAGHSSLPRCYFSLSYAKGGVKHFAKRACRGINLPQFHRRGRFHIDPPCKIRLDGEWVDLISSEAKPKISSALADFILASARISFLQEFEFIRKTAENIFFVAHRQRITVILIQGCGYFLFMV